MIMRKLHVALLFVGVLCLFAAQAQAHDFLPPDWWGPGSWGDPAQNYAGWGFGDPILPGDPLDPPDFGKYIPGTKALWNPGTFDPPEWLPEYEPWQFPPYVDREQTSWPGDVGLGVVPLSGEIVIDMPNDPIPRPEKKVYIQLTWAPQTGALNPNPVIELLDPPSETSNVTQVDVDGTFPGSGWNFSIFEFSIFPNPPFETIRISGDIMVDQVVVDTWCVPEPGTFVLLGTGLMALFGYGWYRRKR